MLGFSSHQVASDGLQEPVEPAEGTAPESRAVSQCRDWLGREVQEGKGLSAGFFGPAWQVPLPPALGTFPVLWCTSSLGHWPQFTLLQGPLLFTGHFAICK